MEHEAYFSDFFSADNCFFSKVLSHKGIIFSSKTNFHLLSQKAEGNDLVVQPLPPAAFAPKGFVRHWQRFSILQRGKAAPDSPAAQTDFCPKQTFLSTEKCLFPLSFN